MTACAIAQREKPPRVCGTCEGTRWALVGEDPKPQPCPTCKPYGHRTPAASIHAPGARVYNKWLERAGTVLRASRGTQGTHRPSPYVFCDVQYDGADRLLAIAWEQDLEPRP